MSEIRSILFTVITGLALVLPAMLPMHLQAQAKLQPPSSLPAPPFAPSALSAPSAPAKATFAGGCFWCMEAPFDALPGVISTTPGYIGGQSKNPTYKEVSSGRTGHAEAVQIVYDPKKISYEKLLEVFWHNIDPTVVNRQFCDAGTQYRSGIFVHDDAQKKAAEAAKAALQKTKPFRGDIVTEIVTAPEFYPAEEYHQDYYKKNPGHYAFYRAGCGRDDRLKMLWGAEAGGGKH